VKSSDRTILLVVLGLVALGALWFGVISPKRSELAKLDEDVASAQATVSSSEQLAAAAAEAKDSYRSDYRRLIVLGKAVPGDDDAASLIDQVDVLAGQAGVEFSGLRLVADGSGDAAAAAAVETSPPEESEAPAEGEEGAEGEAPVAPPAAPTEAAAADLPLGAAVGPAGLPVMPYDLTFEGNFFEIADFMAGLDGLVRAERDGLGVDGRLITVDSFNLAPHPDVGFPTLTATLHVTTFVAPADQGATGGAEPAAPAPAATPAAAPTTAPTAPTAAATAPTP
jgi:Tfp pilus assembly protein PilO